MNKTKEIEEMAKYFCGRRNRICKLCCSFTGGVCVENCKFLQFSKDLHNAGYGNIKQAVKEFAELLDNKAQDLNGDSWDEYNEGFKRGVEETLFLMYDLITDRKSVV